MLFPSHLFPPFLLNILKFSRFFVHLECVLYIWFIIWCLRAFEFFFFWFERMHLSPFWFKPLRIKYKLINFKYNMEKIALRHLWFNFGKQRFQKIFITNAFAFINIITWFGLLPRPVSFPPQIRIWHRLRHLFTMTNETGFDARFRNHTTRRKDTVRKFPKACRVFSVFVLSHLGRHHHL